jgi:hypothetical protein
VVAFEPIRLAFLGCRHAYHLLPKLF